MTYDVPTDALGNPLVTRSVSGHRKSPPNELRKNLAAIREAWRGELDALPASAIWPQLEALVVALTYSSGTRRFAALEATFEHLLHRVADERKRLIKAEEA